MRRPTPSGLFGSFMALALVASSASAQTQERSGLRWKLEQGGQLRYKLSWALEQRIDMGGQEIPQALDVECTLDQRVTAMNGDVATIEVTIAAMKAHVGMGPFGEMQYDSAAPVDDGNPFSWLKDAMGKTFTYTMKPTGEVTSVTGADAIQKELLAILQAQAEERMRQGGGDDMGGMGMGMGMDPATLTAQAVIVFGDGSMKTALGVLSHVVPDSGKAKEGDTYSRETTEAIPAMGTLTYQQKFTVGAAAGSAVRLAWVADGEIAVARDLSAGAPGEDEGAADPMREMQKALMEKLEVKRKAVSGSASFDGGRSRLIDSEAVHELDLEGPLPPMVQAMMGPQGKDAKMKQFIVLTLRYVEDTSAAPAQPQTPAPGGGDGKGGRSSF